MDKYAFFLDIDGTLTSAGGICEENKLAIKKARELGHKIFINSGRSMGYVPQCVREVEFDGYVVGIGCYITYGDELVLSVAIPPEEVAEMFDKFTSEGKEVVLEGEIQNFRNKYNENEDFILLENGREYVEKYSDSRITKFFVPYNFSEKELDFIRRRYTAFQHPTYLEYAPKGYSKATGMEMLLQKCNIPRERCVAIGDSANDIDMLKYAGISVAVGNAQDEVKALCTKITAPANEGGVGKAICEIIGISLQADKPLP